MAGTGCPTNTNIRHNVRLDLSSSFGSHVEMKFSIFLLACCARRLFDQLGFFFLVLLLLLLQFWHMKKPTKLVVICRFGVASMVEFFCWIYFFFLSVFRLLLRIFSAILFNAYSPLLKWSVQRNVWFLIHEKSFRFVCCAHFFFPRWFGFTFT